MEGKCEDLLALIEMQHIQMVVAQWSKGSVGADVKTGLFILTAVPWECEHHGEQEPTEFWNALVYGQVSE